MTSTYLTMTTLATFTCPPHVKTPHDPNVLLPPTQKPATYFESVTSYQFIWNLFNKSYIPSSRTNLNNAAVAANAPRKANAYGAR